MEYQLTTAQHGHILTNIACWTRDSQWLVYDTRSDAAGSQFDGQSIQRVHVPSGRVETVFESTNGACCGVATCCPVTERIIFIHGPEKPTVDWQYAPYHRRGAIVDTNSLPGSLPNTARHASIPLEANCYAPPFVPGALRGGSHVHTWDRRGQRVAFTYEDHVLALADRNAQSAAQTAVQHNQRNIGISDPMRGVVASRSHGRNHDGSHFSVIVTKTVDQPQPGSDEIDRAYEDAWLGGDGKRLAFLGDVAGQSGRRFAELFLLELPDDLTQPGELGPLEGTATTRPAPPRGCTQRRLTFTEDRPQSGIVGPRHWPRSTPDGSLIFCLMSDAHRQPQLFSVSPDDGKLQQVTRVEGGVSSAFSVSSDGQWLAYVASGSVMLSSIDGRHTRRLTNPDSTDSAPRPEACVISPDGKRIAYVRRVNAYNQIYVCDVA